MSREAWKFRTAAAARAGIEWANPLGVLLGTFEFGQPGLLFLEQLTLYELVDLGAASYHLCSAVHFQLKRARVSCYSWSSSGILLTFIPLF